MLTQRELFLKHQAQTSDAPLMLEFEKAEGMYIYDANKKAFMDIISGISVSNLGHRHPKVIQAAKDQMDKYTYLMVYGEYIQSPQVKLAKMLAEVLPASLDATFFVNSGSEAVEGALKLAKRYTGKTEMVAFKNAYHGSTHGCLSMIGDEFFRNNFRPLLPGVSHIQYNKEEDLAFINENTAAVLIEAVQAEAGLITPTNDFLKKVRAKCDEVGALMILDEIQTGYGRTGTLFAFEQFDIVPDILCLAKGMGGGFQLGAFISAKHIMDHFKSEPWLGHITTFGGHPVSCAAGVATLETLIENKAELIDTVKAKEQLFKDNLKHPAINEIRSFGLMMAVEFDNYEINKAIIDDCIANGILTDWFLFADNCLRIAPPLIISEEEIVQACTTIKNAINKFCI